MIRFLICAWLLFVPYAVAASAAWTTDDVIKVLWGAVTVLLGVLWADLRHRLNLHEKKVNELEVSNAEIVTQLRRVVSDIESEKRTRTEVNRLMFDKLDRLWERSGRKRQEDS